MFDLFASPWHDLSIDDVRAFLDEAPREGLLWEAKGNDVRPAQIRKAACAFANSESGGFLILGANEDKARPVGDPDRWTMVGLDRSADTEATTWITNVIHGNLRPAPDIDVRELPVNGRCVAVVWIAPVDAPPSISDGTVYERLPGISIPVKDPLRLQHLYEAGRIAHETAHRSAARSAKRVLRDTGALDARGRDPRVALALAVATVAAPGDIVARLHQESYLRALQGQLRTVSVDGAGMHNDDNQVLQSQDAVAAWRGSKYAEGRILATWDGAVGIAHCIYESRGSSATFRETIPAAWSATLAAAHDLKGRPAPHYMAIALVGPPYADNTRLTKPAEPVFITRGPIDFVPDEHDAALTQVHRELARCANEFAFEPEDDD